MLDAYQTAMLFVAEQDLRASEQDTNPANYSKHLGRLEVRLADMIRIVKELQAK